MYLIRSMTKSAGAARSRARTALDTRGAPDIVPPEISSKPKLNAILAVEKGRRTELHTLITNLHKVTQQPALLTGHHKRYTARKEDGEAFPDDQQVVQLTHEAAVRDISGALKSLLDTVATKDWTNCEARADVMVDGKVFHSCEGVAKR